MGTIQDLLNRRNDLSTFVVHLSRDRIPGGSALANLESIISDRTIRAFTPMGWAKAEDDPLDPRRQTQRAVSFSETPLEHIYSLYAEITDRGIHLRPYGLALTKVVARTMGLNPVWYVDMTPRGGREWEEARALDALRDEGVQAGDFHAHPLAKVLPFFEQMGTWPESRKEFWWEREWRHRGNLDLTPNWDRIIWLCPDNDRERVETLVRQNAPAASGGKVICIDPSWGLEQVIARLCGFDDADVTLFHASPGREGEDLARELQRQVRGNPRERRPG